MLKRAMTLGPPQRIPEFWAEYLIFVAKGPSKISSVAIIFWNWPTPYVSFTSQKAYISSINGARGFPRKGQSVYI